MRLLACGTTLCLLTFALVVSPARAEKLPLKVYTTADGLASSVVLDIVADSRGFLWFATRDGLSRFDGSAFRTYTTDDGLPNPVVNTLIETRDGEYWVATNGGGICRLIIESRRTLASANDARPASSGSLFECHSVGTEFLSNRVNVLLEDRRGRIWLGTDGGVFRIERGAAPRVESVPLGTLAAGRSIASRAMHEDRAGRVWIGSTTGLIRVDQDERATMLAVRGVALPDIRNISEYGDALWVGSSVGLLRIRPEAIDSTEPQTTRVLDPVNGCLQHGVSGSWVEDTACVVSSRDGLQQQPVTALGYQTGGPLWIGTTRGLASLDGRRFTLVTTPGNVIAARLSTLTPHAAGHLWIGTDAGAVKLTVNGMITYGTEDGLGHPRVRRLFLPQSGSHDSVVVVGADWVVSRFDGRRFRAMRPQIPAGATYTYYSHGAFLDHSQRWWLLTDRGLYRFRPHENIEAASAEPPERVFTQLSGLPNDRADRIFEDSRGNIWIANRSATSAWNLSRWHRATGEIRVFTDGFGAEHQFPLAFAEDRGGAVWVGFESGGLARYHGDRFRVFGVADGVPPNILALHLTADGALWIATASHGLAVLRDVTSNPPRFERYTTANGLSSNNVQCLTDDRWGRIYAGTSRGVDRLDPVTGRVTHFGTSDGLAGDYVTSALRDRSGALWFGTTEGVSRMIPTADRPSAPPPVWIGEVRGGGGLQPISELGTTALGDLVLEPNQNHLQIAFFGIPLGAGGPLRYRYRLEGAQSVWSEPDHQRVVTYASLAPGRYRFAVEAIAADGVVSRQPASVGFTVLPPVWQRAWFVTLAMAVLSGAAFALHRLRVARILAVERIRARIAADLHDDIGGSLSRIAIQSEVARRGLPDPASPSARQLVEIGDTARTVVESLADVVWSVDPVQDDLASVERRIREYAADVLGPRGVRWTFHGTGLLDRFTLGPESRRDLLLLLKEGITNIARHADAQVASLHLGVMASELHAELRDDGHGFDPSACQSGDAAARHGLDNMRMRIGRLGGRMAINSAPGRGTTVTLTVPLKYRRPLPLRVP